MPMAEFGMRLNLYVCVCAGMHAYTYVCVCACAFVCFVGVGGLVRGRK